MKQNLVRAITQDNIYNTKQYIDKTRKLMLMKYNSLIQKEVKLRIDENKDNSLQLKFHTIIFLEIILFS